MFDPIIVLTLLFEGLANGAIYAFMALAIVVLYSVTNVINVAVGEFAMLSALSVVSFRAQETPGTLYILVAGIVAWSVLDSYQFVREKQLRRGLIRLVSLLFLALVVSILTTLAARASTPYFLQVAFAIFMVTLLGLVSHRLMVQPLPKGSILVFLIMTIGLHLALTGLGLAFWGADAYNLPAIQKGGTLIAGVYMTYQNLWLLGIAALLMLLLYLFFMHTIYGKALRAAAVNKLGAKLSGISSLQAGRLSFIISTFLAAIAGILITPITKMVYDLGFLMGLKGFVAAVIGGLVNPAGAALAGLFVGVAEQFGAFYISSTYKDVLIFAMLIPVLMLRSFQHHDLEEHVDE